MFKFLPYSGIMICQMSVVRREFLELLTGGILWGSSELSLFTEKCLTVSHSILACVSQLSISIRISIRHQTLWDSHHCNYWDYALLETMVWFTCNTRYWAIYTKPSFFFSLFPYSHFLLSLLYFYPFIETSDYCICLPSPSYPSIHALILRNENIWNCAKKPKHHCYRTRRPSPQTPWGLPWTPTAG